MSRNLKWAFGCHALALLLLAVFSLIYLFRSEFMPYHAAAVEQVWREIDPAFQVLILALMRAAGEPLVKVGTPVPDPRMISSMIFSCVEHTLS